MDDPYYLDPRLTRRAFNRASVSFDAHAILHTEVRNRLLQRLHLLRAKPAVIVDLGAGTGHGSQSLKKQFPQAQVIAIDSATQMLAQSRHRQGWRRRFVPLGGDALALPLRSASVDWVVSNLMLQWTPSIDAVFAEVKRVLKPNGVFSFTTLGPDTLRELRLACAEQSYPRVHNFIDMHDIGDALIRAQFAEPVLDIEHFTLTYANVAALMQELKATGSSNRASSRYRSLTTRARIERIVGAYDQRRVDGKIPATFEVIYAQAWRLTTDRPANQTGETRVPIANLRRR